MVSTYLVRDYAHAAEYLADGRRGAATEDRPIEPGHHSRIVRRDDSTIALRLHATDVLTWHQDGRTVLDSGGWRTVTTKARINEYAPMCAETGRAWRLWSERGAWYLADPDHSWDDSADCGHVVPFFDGATIKNGRLINAPSAAKVARAKATTARMAKRIETYISAYMAKLGKGMAEPSGGDCWYCTMFVDPMARADTGHLLSHLAERYYVPSLAVLAMRSRGMTQQGIALRLRMTDAPSGLMVVKPGTWEARDVKRALRHYLRSQLTTAGR